jgi:tetratricopeptide (TPR) repeat protein
MTNTQELYEKAIKKENSFLRFFYSSYDYDTIADMYEECGRGFSLDKKWELSIEAYMNAVRLYIKAKSYLGIVDIYNKVSNIYMIHLNNLPKAIEVLELVLLQSNTFNMRCRPTHIASIHKGLALLYEKNNQIDKAIESYGQACNIYELDGGYKLQFKQCLTKLADLECSVGDYNMGLQAYKKLIGMQSYIDDTILFKIVLCNLINEDVVSASITSATYKSTRYIVNTFLKAIISAVEQNDINMLIAAKHVYTVGGGTFGNIESGLFDKLCTTMNITTQNTPTVAQDIDEYDLS